MKCRFNRRRLFGSVEDYSLSRPRLCNGRTQRTIAFVRFRQTVIDIRHRKCDVNDALIFD